MRWRLLYFLWLIGRHFKFAFRSSGQRATNWLPFGAGVLGFGADLAGVKVIFAEGWQGPIVQGLIATGIAWVVILLCRLGISPWRIWKDGKWYEDRFVYNEPQLAYAVQVSPSDNNKPHRFRFPDAPPNSFVNWTFEVDRMSLINVDVRCRPFQLTTFTEAINRQAGGGGTRVNWRRDMCMTTFLRPDSVSMSTRIYITSWER
jgi:hypothetical protein